MVKLWKADVPLGKTCNPNQSVGWYFSFNCVITEKYMYYDNDSYKLALYDPLGEINMIPLIILNKTQSFFTG